MLEFLPNGTADLPDEPDVLRRVEHIPGGPLLLARGRADVDLRAMLLNAIARGSEAPGVLDTMAGGRLCGDAEPTPRPAKGRDRRPRTVLELRRPRSLEDRV